MTGVHSEPCSFFPPTCQECEQMYGVVKEYWIVLLKTLVLFLALDKILNSQALFFLLHRKPVLNTIIQRTFPALGICTHQLCLMLRTQGALALQGMLDKTLYVFLNLIFISNSEILLLKTPKAFTPVLGENLYVFPSQLILLCFFSCMPRRDNLHCVITLIWQLREYCKRKKERELCLIQCTLLPGSYT